MILNNLAEAKQFLPSVNLTVANNRFTDFFMRSQTWLVNHVIGTDIETLLEAAVPANTADQHADLRRLVQRVIAERAFLKAVPEMDMQLTEAGFAVQNNDNFTPASSQRVDRLLNTMPSRIVASCDALVLYLMQHSANGYSAWRTSTQFAHLTQCFMPMVDSYYNFDGSIKWTVEDYYNYITQLKRGMFETASPFVSEAEISRLVELYRDNDMLEIHRRAIAELEACAVYAAKDDRRRALNAAARARTVMMEDPDKFPSFKASKEYANSSVNLNAGKIVNFT